MSCHRGAAYTATHDVTYVVHGFVDKGDPALFGDGVTAEFLWSLAFRAHDPPFVGPIAGLPPTTTTTTRPPRQE
jgi:hypothetical protein